MQAAEPTGHSAPCSFLAPRWLVSDLAEVDSVPEEIGEGTFAEGGPALAPDPAPGEILHEGRQAL